MGKKALSEFFINREINKREMLNVGCWNVKMKEFRKKWKKRKKWKNWKKRKFGSSVCRKFIFSFMIHISLSTRKDK